MAEDSIIGQVVLGRYRIVKRLAKGGMGTIYLARNEGAAGFVRPVVVKRILPGTLDESTAVRLFQREARIMAHLRHPGIVSVIDFTHDEHGYIMVLDYVHGYHLAKWSYFARKTRGPFPAEVAVQIVASVLDALHYAHTITDADGRALQIVHRDIKPSNVLIDVDGYVKLLDFGIAQMVDDRTVASNQEAAVRGTFPYMAPELFKSADPSPVSDLYACGVVLHEVLSGRNEFRVKDMSLTVARVLQHTPTRLDRMRTDVPPALAEAVAKALAKDPHDRYASAAEFAQALRDARTLSSDAAHQHVAAAAERDYRDPRFAELLRVDTLDVLEKAWRTPPPAVASGHDAETAPTATAHGARGDEAAATPAVRRWRVISAVVAAVSIATIGVVFAMRRHGGGEGGPRYILVSGDVAAADGTQVHRAAAAHATAPNRVQPAAAAPRTAGSAGADASTGAPAARAERPPRPQHRPSAADSLSQAFRRQEGKIRRCFDDNAAAAIGSPRLAVRFHIGRDGAVEQAELVPPQTMHTPLGACLVKVAKATRFGPQPHPITFRIPIAVHSER